MPTVDPQLRELFVFRAGGRRFAVFAEEVEGVGESLRPAPLPFAPPAVLGVVSLRGRVRTALDPLKLLGTSGRSDAAATGAAADTIPPAAANATPPAADAADAPADKPPAAIEPSAADERAPRLFVALAGDEQLALACDGAEESFAVSDAEIQPPPAAELPARGILHHDGSTVTLLDPSRLFDAAMRGTDRRRRRT